MSGTGRLVVGTSGFSYAHWRGDFYPEGIPQSRWLEVYAETFSSVELNVTFYRSPSPETFGDWASRTPEHFAFVVKGSRTITHYRRLREVREPLRDLLRAAARLDGKLECVLWQLPPRTAPDLGVLDRFCELVDDCARSELPGIRVRNAFEFRDERWFSDDVLDVLRSHECALVLADPGRTGQPRDAVTADFTYVRFHQGPRPSGAYEDEELRVWAESAGRWLENGIDVYAYFNNDAGGWAPRNAQRFRDLVADRAPVAVR